MCGPSQWRLCCCSILAIQVPNADFIVLFHGLYSIARDLGQGRIRMLIPSSSTSISSFSCLPRAALLLTSSANVLILDHPTHHCSIRIRWSTSHRSVAMTLKRPNLRSTLRRNQRPSQPPKLPPNQRLKKKSLPQRRSTHHLFRAQQHQQRTPLSIGKPPRIMSSGLHALRYKTSSGGRTRMGICKVSLTKMTRSAIVMPCLSCS